METKVEIDPYLMEQLLQLLLAQEKELKTVRKEVERLQEQNSRINTIIKEAKLLDWWAAFDGQGNWK